MSFIYSRLDSKCVFDQAYTALARIHSDKVYSNLLITINSFSKKDIIPFILLDPRLKNNEKFCQKMYTFFQTYIPMEAFKGDMGAIQHIIAQYTDHAPLESIFYGQLKSPEIYEFSININCPIYSYIDSHMGATIIRAFHNHIRNNFPY